MILTRRRLIGTLAAAPLMTGLPARADNAAVIDTKVDLALSRLYKEVAGARELSQRAVGILVMPEVIKGGFIVGGSYGEGALRTPPGFDRSAAYYSVAAASIGLQAGVQTSSQALFFLTERALANFRRADGWEVGADAEVTIPDRGANIGLDSTTQQKPIIAIVFGEDGLLIGASLAGAKYSPINRG